MLAGDADDMIAQRSAGALLSQPPQAFLAALAQADPAQDVFRYCSQNMADKPGIADALAKNPHCPAGLLLPAVRYLTVAGLQGLMENLDRLSSAPALAAAVAASSSLTADQRRELQELQQESSDPAAIEEAVAAVEPDRAKRQTLVQRLSRMRVVERVQLALKGNREDRTALIRDPCKVVQRAVLQSSRLTDQEVEAYASMASLSEEVLRLIAGNRNYRKNYAVLRNLLKNPKTPLDISLHLLPNLTPQDLKLLTANRNIPDTLRNSAMRLQRQRSETKPGG